MANRTDSNAISVHGTNPQFLIEKIVRLKIHSSTYWKEQCYALTAETLVDRAVELEYVGGTYGGSRKPAPFLCLVLKMLQLQPEQEIVYEFVKNKDYKYVTALGSFYLRLIGRSEEIYSYLEPLYNDYRKLRLRETDGSTF
jgi:pre-mRNA-splicing factor 38A